MLMVGLLKETVLFLRHFQFLLVQFNCFISFEIEIAGPSELVVSTFQIIAVIQGHVSIRVRKKRST